MSKELIERLRNTTYYRLDPYEAADRIEQLEAEVAAIKAEVAHWKSNHETEVRRARILKERTDMPIERVNAYEQWGKDQMALKEAQEAAEFNFQQYQDAGRLLCEAQAEIERLRTGLDRFLWSCEECTDQDGWLAFMCSAVAYHEARSVLEWDVNDET